MIRRIIVHTSVFGLVIALSGAAWAQQQQQQPQQQPQQQQQQQQFDQQRQQDAQWQRQQGDRPADAEPRRTDERMPEWRPLQDPDLRQTAPRPGDAPHVVSGTIQQTREIDHRGERNLQVGVETFDRQFVVIDLGPARQAREIRDLIREGERITVTGQQAMFDGRPVFIADHVRVAGERFDLPEDVRQARFERDRFERDRFERDRFDRADQARFQQDRFDRDMHQDRPREQARTLTGTVTQFRETDHMGERHLHLQVRTQDDQFVTVDLGPVQEVRQVRNVLREGERINVTGRQKMLDGQQVFIAERGQIAGQRFELDQWAQQARYQTDMDRQMRTDRDQFDRQRTDRDRQAWEQQQRTDRQFQPDRQRERERVARPDQRQAPEGYVLVSERVVVLLTDQLNSHFINARTQLQQENFDRAAAETRVAAEFIDMYAGIAEGDARNELESVKNELRNLSQRIEAEEVTQRRELDRQFARAHRALAKYNIKEARELQDEDRSVAAGYRVRAAARHLQQAFAFSDAQVDQDATRVFQEAQQASARMIRGQDVEDQDQLIQRIERQIDRMGDQFN